MCRSMERRYFCVDGPRQGHVGTISTPIEGFRLRSETGWYAPKRPATFRDTALPEQVLEVFWCEGER